MIADGKCQVVIDIPPALKIMETKWSSVWEAVEATVAKCVRARKGGKSGVVATGWSFCLIPHGSYIGTDLCLFFFLSSFYSG